MIYLLLMIGTNTSLIGKTTVDVDTIIFTEKEKCLEQREKNALRLQNKYSTLYIECVERKLNAR